MAEPVGFLSAQTGSDLQRKATRDDLSQPCDPVGVLQEPATELTGLLQALEPTFPNPV